MSLISHVRSKAIVVARRGLRAAYIATHRLPKDLAGLLEHYAASRSAAVDTADALALYEAVVTRKPKSILELGPGTSTAVIALAILAVQKEQPDYSPEFLALEENPDWLSYHEQGFPPELRSLVDMQQMNSEPAEIDGVRTSRFTAIPRRPYDLIHIDGPDFLSHGARHSCDTIDLAPACAPRCLVIFDGRQDSARLAAQNLPDWKLYHHPFTLNLHLERS